MCHPHCSGLRAVLALAEGMVTRRNEDACAMLPCLLVVTVRVGHTHHDKVRTVHWHLPLGHHDACIARFELNAVIGDRRRTVKPSAVQSQSAAAPTSG